jgi:hypothetical protein
MLDYETSLVREDMDVNVIYLYSMDYSLVGNDEVAEMSFDPRDTIFQRPKDSENHLKPLYIQGHLDGMPISRMLIDGGAIINDVGDGDPIGAKGVDSMELIAGSKTLATAFFVTEVQGNYSIILGARLDSFQPLHIFYLTSILDPAGW